MCHLELAEATRTPARPAIHTARRDEPEHAA